MSRRPQPIRDRSGERGFALLLIFALAGAVAVLLYLELPRAVFESARAKEDLLVERGEQYKLAIRRYFVKTRQLPNSIDQLENTNGVRFLRRRYKDPMTGQDEWRLVHWGAGGYTDSKVFKPKDEAKSDSRPGSVGGGYQVGGGGAGPLEGNEKGQQDVALRQRPSDRLPQPGTGGIAGFANPDGGANPNPGDPPPPDQPQQFDPATGQPVALPSTGSTPNPPGNPLYPGQQFVPGQGQVPAQNAPGFPANPPFPGAAPNPVNSQTGGTVPVAVGGSIGGGTSALGGAPAGTPAPGLFPGQPGYPSPQQQIQQAGRPLPGSGNANPAVDMIRNLLTQPRQGPLGAAGTQAGGTPVAAGIAGVASKAKGVGIKRINERERIDEWEFLFDPSQPAKGVAGAGQMGGAAGGNPANPANPGGNGSFGPGGTGFGSSGSAGSGRPGSVGFGSPTPTPAPGGRRP